MMNFEIQARLRESGVIAVVTIESADQAISLGEALLAGGIDVIELTLRSDAALDSIKRITSSLPDILVGAGTVIRPQQVLEVQDAGASFAVSPGTNPRVMQAAQDAALPFAPGVCTPSDIEVALESDCKILKFFPAEQSGGLPYLKSMAAPYRHLGVEFIPLGGLNETNAGEYLSSSLTIALGGSWIAPPGLIASERWDEIELRARKARELKTGIG